MLVESLIGAEILVAYLLAFFLDFLRQLECQRENEVAGAVLDCGMQVGKSNVEGEVQELVECLVQSHLFVDKILGAGREPSYHIVLFELFSF